MHSKIITSVPTTETEGKLSRTVYLYHPTNKESAYAILRQNSFKKKQDGYGLGYYFTESRETADKKNIADKAIVYCEVMIGISLVLRNEDPTLCEKKLKKLECDSVKATFANEYIIFNYKNIINVVGALIDDKIIRNYEIFSKCTNELCKMQATCHYPEPCKLLCKEKACKHFNSHHFPPCELICKKKNCELVNTYHEGFCRFRCNNDNCLKFGIYHIGECVFSDSESSDNDCPKVTLDIYKAYKERNNLNQKKTRPKKKSLNNWPSLPVDNPKAKSNNAIVNKDITTNKGASRIINLDSEYIPMQNPLDKKFSTKTKKSVESV